MESYRQKSSSSCKDEGAWSGEGTPSLNQACCQEKRTKGRGILNIAWPGSCKDMILALSAHLLEKSLKIIIVMNANKEWAVVGREEVEILIW